MKELQSKLANYIEENLDTLVGHTYNEIPEIDSAWIWKDEVYDSETMSKDVIEFIKKYE